MKIGWFPSVSAERVTSAQRATYMINYINESKAKPGETSSQASLFPYIEVELNSKEQRKNIMSNESIIANI
jgi:hypothetical protein